MVEKGAYGRSQTGVELTDEALRRMAEQTEAGFDVTKLRRPSAPADDQVPWTHSWADSNQSCGRRSTTVRPRITRQPQASCVRPSAGTSSSLTHLQTSTRAIPKSRYLPRPYRRVCSQHSLLLSTRRVMTTRTSRFARFGTLGRCLMVDISARSGTLGPVRAPPQPSIWRRCHRTARLCRHETMGRPRSGDARRSRSRKGTPLLPRCRARLPRHHPQGRGPRLHPVCPVIDGDGLYVFIGSHSPKLHDLLGDHRFALRSFPIPEKDDEFYVAGTTRVVEDEQERSQVYDTYTAQGTCERTRMMFS